MSTQDCNLTLAVIGCQQAIFRNYLALDQREYGVVAAGFARDGAWHRHGKVFTGPDEIVAELQARPVNLTTAHLVQNFVAEPYGDSLTRASYWVIAFVHLADSLMHGPAPIDFPQVILLQTDILIRSDGGWLIRERRSQQVFGR